MIDTVWLVVLAFFIQAVGYAAIAQPTTFAHAVWGAARDVEQPPEDGDVSGPEAVSAEGKYRRSSLSEGRSQKIHRQILEHMATQRPYLEGGLKLRDVAARIGISSHHLSQVINQETGTNFFDFVNRYRVEEAKRRLTDPESRSLTVLAIGLESGFNNKASFNSAFRKFANTTPSAYRDSSSASAEGHKPDGR